jgi:hypothetical protein
MVIAVKDIARWVQPAPTVTAGDALAEIFSSATARVSGFATASIPLSPRFPISVRVSGSAPVALDGTTLLLSRLLALAQVVFDNTGSNVPNVAARVAFASVDIVATATVRIASDANAYLLFLTGFPVAVPQLGSAEIAFADYGQGSVPVFPFTLPTLFTDGSNDHAADAVVAFNCVGTVDGAGGFADASVELVGAVAASIKGTVTVFPYRFPAVFDSNYSGQSGMAEFGLIGYGPVEVAVLASASITIGGAGQSLSAAVLPFRFPTLFFEPYQLGDAQVVCSAVGDIAVEVGGDSVVSIATEGLTIEITRFPFRLPARFLNF